MSVANFFRKKATISNKPKAESVPAIVKLKKATIKPVPSRKE